MEIAKQDIAAIVEISGQTWVITINGQWIPAEEVTSSVEDINIELLDPDDISLESNQPVVQINGQWLTIPSNVISSMPTTTLVNNNSQDNNQANSSPEQQQGFSFFFQWLQRDGNEEIAESGYDTTGSTNQDFESNPNSANSNNDEDPVIPNPILTINIEDGGDEWVNQFESPVTDLFGSAQYMSNGQSLTVTLTDIEGKQLSFITTAQNQAWSINDVNLNELAEGLLNADIKPSDLTINYESSQDTSVKDTIAEISLNIEKTDGVNDNQNPTTSFFGEVVDIQDNQPITLRILTPDGDTISSFDTTVIDGAWLIENVDTSTLSDGSYLVSVSSIDLAGNPASAERFLFQDETIGITVEVIENCTSDGETFDIVGTVTDVEDGNIVNLTLRDTNNVEKTFQVTVQNGFYALLDVDMSGFADGQIDVTATVSDFSDNQASATTDYIYDTLALITIDIEGTDDNVLNAEEDNSVAISGTAVGVEDGQTVYITLTDDAGNILELTSTVNNETWQVDDVDLSSFNNGTITASATTKDTNCNTATDTDTVEHDKLASITVEVIENCTSDGETFDIVGTVTDVEDGNIVNLTLRDTNNVEKTFQVTVQNGFYALLDVDMSGFADGQIDVTATVSDFSDNQASATTDYIYDTLALITIDIEGTDDNVLNAEEDNSVAISGTAVGVEDGQTVYITLTDDAGNILELTSTVNNETWQVDDVDLSSFNNGTITASATTKDTNCNTATDTDTVEHDKLASITVEVIENCTSDGETFDIVGTVTDVEDGQTVDILLRDSNNLSKTLQATVVNGTYSLIDIDMAGFADGNIEVTVSVNDVAGNLASANTSYIYDSLAELTISINDTEDNVINAIEDDNVVISGTAVGIENGQPVYITLTDENGNSIEVTATVSNETWQLNNVDISALDNGTITASATSKDLNCNSASAEDAALHDKIAEITLTTTTTPAEQGLLYSFTGTTTDIEDGNNVLITLTDRNGQSQVLSAVIIDGVYSVENISITLADGPILVSAQTQDNAGNPAEANEIINFDNTAEITVDIDSGDDEIINAVEAPNSPIFGTVIDVEDGQTVTINVSDENNNSVDFEAVVEDGQWRVDNADLSTLADGTLTITSQVTDLSNNTAQASTTILKDTLATVTITIDSGIDEALNKNEITQTRIFGQTTEIENGQTVFITVTDKEGNSLTFETEVLNDAWALEDLDLSSLVDGPLTASATVSDIAGNEAQSSDNVFKDTTSGITLNVIEQCHDGVEILDLVGTVENVEDGSPVFIIITDSNNNELRFQATSNNGVWSHTDADLTGLGDGELNIKAYTTDRSGNIVETEQTFIKDTVAEITIDVETGTDEVINSAETPATTISGTATNVEDGQIVELTITDLGGKELTFEATVTNGEWIVEDADLSILDEGSLEFSATVKDLSCNTATATVDHVKDTLASVTITVESNGDNLINSLEVDAVTLYGDANYIENGREVVITVIDSDNFSKEYSTTVSNEQWEIPDLDFNEFAEGPLNFTVSTSDIAGNTATNSTEVFKDTLSKLSIQVVTNGDNILNELEVNPAAFGGVANDIETGQTVEIIVTDSENKTSSFETVVRNGYYLIDNEDLSGLADGELTFTATSEDREGNPATATTTVIKNTAPVEITIDIEAGTDNIINDVESPTVDITGTTVNVEDGATVTVTLIDANGDDLTLTATVANNQWRIDDVDTRVLIDGTINGTASVTNSVGNSGTATEIVGKDVVAELTLSLNDEDQIINHTESTLNNFSGTVNNIENGQSVTLTLTDKNNVVVTATTQVVNDAWSLGDIDLSTLADGEITAIVEAQDKAENPASSTITFDKDTLAEITIEVEDDDQIINAAEQDAVSVSGVATGIENGQTVTVSVTDSAGTTRTNDSVTLVDGKWSLNDVDINDLAEGDLVVTVTSTDIAGNEATNTVTVLKDTLASLTIDVADGGDNSLNALEVNDVAISGTALNVDDGQTVTVLVTDSAGKTQEYYASVSNGAWALNNEDLSGFAEGILTFTANVTDVAGNPASADTTVFKDTLSTISIQVGTNGDGILNGDEITSTTFGGAATDIEDGQVITVTVTDSENETLEFTTTVRNGYYLIDNEDLAELADGELTFTAEGVDRNDNPATATTTVVKNTAPVEITIDIDTIQDNIINAAEAPMVDITGTVSNVEDGQTVTVTLTDGVNTITRTALVNGGAWFINDVDTQILSDGDITGTATVTNMAGNSESSQEIVQKDVVAEITVQLNDEDQIINNAEKTANSFSGTVNNIEDVQEITITFTDSNDNTVEQTTQVTDGGWTLENIDLSTLIDGEINVTVSVQDVAENPATDTITFIKDTQASITVNVIDDDQIINKAEQSSVDLSGTITNIEEGKIVTVTLVDSQNNSLEYTTPIENAEWQLNNIDFTVFAEGSIEVTVTTTDIAGNEATANTSVTKDTLASLTITVDDGPDNAINAREVSAVLINGTASNIEDDQSVTILITDIDGVSQQYTTTVSAGVWSLGELDLSDFAEGELSFSVSGTDAAGNPAEADTQTFKDTISAISMQIQTNGDDILNSFEVNPATFGGVANDIEDDQPVEIVVRDEAGNRLIFSATVQDGFFIIENGDLSSLLDGELTFTATSIDSFGNPAIATNTVTKDTAAVEITVEIDTIQDDTINAVESPAVRIYGTTDAENQQQVTVVLTDKNKKTITLTAIVIDGEWLIENVDTRFLVDGTISAVATVENRAGNSAKATDTALKDVVARTTLALTDSDPDHSDQIINENEETQNNQFSGTITDVEDYQTVTLYFVDRNGNTATDTTTVSGGEWSIDNVDLSNLVDGKIQVRAEVTDQAQNQGSETLLFDKDTLAEIVVEVVDGDDVLSDEEITNGVTIGGAVLGVENGQSVTITIEGKDASDPDNKLTSEVIDGYWSISDSDVFADYADGEITITVATEDKAGNTATNSTTVTKDTSAEIKIYVDTSAVVADTVLNATESLTTRIYGTTDVEDGNTVTIVVKDENGKELTFTTTVTAGLWEVTEDLSSLTDGTLTYTATVSDNAGNSANDNTTKGKDTLAAIEVEIASGDDEYLLKNELGQLTLAGTVTNIEEGRTVTLTLTGANGETEELTATVLNDFTFTTTVDISTWADGEITVTAKTTDEAGNEATNTDTATIDTTVSIDIDTGDGFDLVAFRAGDLTTISGTTDAESGQLVSIAIFDGSQTLYFKGSVGSDGTWSVNNINVTDLNQTAAWELTATVTDLAGNTATDDMPTLDIVRSQELYETELESGSTSDTSAININNASLSLSAMQDALSSLTSVGSEVRVEVASDGQSLNVIREDDSTIAMTIELITGSIRVTQFKSFDQPLNNKLTTQVFIEALQTDDDGTSELVILPTNITINDAPPKSQDDSFTVTEDTTSNGSVTGNDYTTEGPLKVIKIDVEGQTYVVTEASPATVTLSYGVLTVNSNGTWTFTASDNLDHTLPQNFSFNYTVSDQDTSFDTATATINIIDGAAGYVTDQNADLTEPDYDQVLNREMNFTIFAGSDTLLADSIAFNDASLARLNALGLKSDGDEIIFSLSDDGKTMTATADGSTIITISLSALSSGDDLSVTALYQQQGPIDHTTSEQLQLVLTVTAEDLDGTAIEENDLSITIFDGNNPQFNNITNVTLDENNLADSPLVGTGQLSTLIGSDKITEVVFSAIGEQPVLTSNDTVIEYELSEDGKTIIGHTGDINDPVFKVELSNTFNTTLDSLDKDYTVTLYRALDQDVTDGINLKIEMTDFDGDKVTGNLDITIIDNDDVEQNTPELNVSETPKDSSIYTNSDSDFLTITAEYDAIKQLNYEVENGDPVLDSQGNSLTQNGQAITWVNLGNGKAQGQLADGTVVFEATIPADFTLTPGEQGNADIQFELYGAIDHLDAQDTRLTLILPIAIIDADNTHIVNNVAVNIDDGLAPEIVNPGTPDNTVDELNLNNDSVTIHGKYTLSQGSDEIVTVALAEGFSLDGVTKNGEAVTLSNAPTDSGWYVARIPDNSEVFRIRFLTDGTYQYKQSQALDHATGNGKNQLDLEFEIQAIDADGDKSDTQDLTVLIIDDIPVAIDTDLTFSEGDSLTADLLDGVKQGADGAQVTQITYQGTDYQASDTITLRNGDQEYGSITINADGSVSITTSPFIADTNIYEDFLQYQITDADGDVITNTLNLHVQDSEGKIVFYTPEGDEDGNIIVELAAYPGDLDSGDEITEIKISVDSLNGGTLVLQGPGGAPLSLPIESGFVVFRDDNLRVLQEETTLPTGSTVPAGTTLPAGILIFIPAENTSDAIIDQQVALNVDVIITDNDSGSRTISSEIPVTINSVADTPLWDDSAEFYYLGEEDGAPITLNLTANLQDTDGSEVISYRIENIEEGLILKVNGNTVSDGDILSAEDIANLTAEGTENLAGSFNFDITAIATEQDNNDVAEQDARTVTVDLHPVADTPTLIVANVNSDEDVAINAYDFVRGQLTDTDGSESLSFEFTVPDGWTMTALNGATISDLGSNVYSASSADIEAGNIQLIPEEDISSYQNSFPVIVVAISTETEVDGLTINGDTEARSDDKKLTVTIKGVIDPPTVDTGTNWNFDEAQKLLTNTVELDEDELIKLDFLVKTSDDDGSEVINLLIANLSDGVSIVDEDGNPVELEIIRAENGKPVYGVSAEQLQSLYLKPQGDFSGTGIEFDIYTVTTEPDGDSGEYSGEDAIKVAIELTPILDSNAANLATSSSGIEDQAAVLNINPTTADADGSEIITGAVITSIPTDVKLLLDGSEIEFTGSLDLATLADGDLAGFLASGRLAILPKQDFSGEVEIGITYTVIDISDNGDTTPVEIATTSTVTIAPDFDKEIEIDGEGRSELVINSDFEESSTNGRVDLSGAVKFVEADQDGSETIEYIVIILPSSNGYHVDYEGALPDGDGRWIVPITGGTTDSVQDTIDDLLNGVTLVSDNPTDGPIEITVAAKVKDLTDDDAIYTTLQVEFTEGAADSDAGTIGDIQNTVIDAVEDQSISFAGHFNSDFVDDSTGNNNDEISFRILASDLPAGAVLSGTDVEIIHDANGQTVYEYVFPASALDSITISTAGANFSGMLDIPIRVIAVDPQSGDTVIDDSQIISVDVTPIADDITVTTNTNTIEEDTAQPLGISLTFVDDDLSTTTGGIENIVIDPDAPEDSLTIKVSAGTLNDPSDLFALVEGTTDTYKFTGETASELTSALAGVSVTPPLNVSGSAIITLEISGKTQDTTEISTGVVTSAMQDFTSTITLDVKPVTDYATLTVANILGDEDTAISLNGINAQLFDTDGSEVIYVSISGVPDGAVLAKKNGDGTYTGLANNGTDGGDFKGLETYNWSVTSEQLASGNVVIIPPTDFNGDIPLTLQAITKDQDPGTYLTTTADFVVGVRPIGDDIDLIRTPDTSYTANEDDTVTINLVARSLDTNNDENIQLTVKIADDSDESALVGLEGGFIEVSGQRINFTSDEAGGYTATLVIASSEIQNFDFNAGTLAWGDLNMQVDVATIDTATVNGTEMSDTSEVISSEFTVTLEPQVDAPIWINGPEDINVSTTDNIELNIELQNPATHELGYDESATEESGYIEISGYPSGVTFSAGSQTGNVWKIPLDKLDGLKIIGAQDNDNFTLIITPYAELAGESQVGQVQDINVVVSDSTSAGKTAPIAEEITINQLQLILDKQSYANHDITRDNSESFSGSADNFEHELLRIMDNVDSIEP
ncbi:hypothetical protein NQT69_18785 [Pseudoalteromonas shioyasakiensis]|uniref:T1SS-143 repeat domain-containing protein n=1 Tax=Pseudoalteromonas shioyasakiensis TaxID=1190813 RepID=UPI0021183EDA|nr:Ig-like domain-containing protein [Pseudoalteromonas shioyasakiensis]MCQ8880048.1 hypothetical protein [Pseudoalteromonas shioyasakiensis]